MVMLTLVSFLPTRKAHVHVRVTLPLLRRRLGAGMRRRRPTRVVETPRSTTRKAYKRIHVLFLLIHAGVWARG